MAESGAPAMATSAASAAPRKGRGRPGRLGLSKAGKEAKPKEPPIDFATLIERLLKDISYQPLEPKSIGRKRPRDEQAPPKPQAPFQQFAGEQRPKVLEDPEVKAGGLSAVGKKLKELWEAVPQATKDAMQAPYEKAMDEYREKFGVYKKLPRFKVFAKVLRAWMDGREMKKMAKKMKKAAPKRPTAGYMTYGSTVRPALTEAHPEWSRGEVGNAIKEKWEALPLAEQGKFNAAAKVARRQWEKDMAVFRRSEPYRKIVDECKALEIVQGQRMLKLDYESKMGPGKTPPAFSLWAAENKIGGALSLRTEGFKKLPEAEQQRYQEQAAKAAAESKKALQAFHASPLGLVYKRKCIAVTTRALLKAARSIHLVDAPKRPMSAQNLYVESKSKDEDSSETRKRFKEEYETISPEAKKVFEDQEAELVEKWRKEQAAFRQSDAFKNFEEAKKQAFLEARKAMKGKAKLAEEAFTAKPETFPAKPPNAVGLFCKEKGTPVKGMKQEFAKLPQEEMSKFTTESSRIGKEYRETLTKWWTSKDGKSYKSKLALVRKRKALREARDKFLVEMPKKPSRAFRLFCKNPPPETEAEKAADAGAAADQKPERLSKRMMARWTNSPLEVRQKYEELAKAKLADYEKALADFKASQQFQEYEKVAKKFGRAAPKAKAKGKAKAKAKAGVKRPESFPKAPPKALTLFAKEANKEGNKKLLVQEFQKLAPEERSKFNTEAIRLEKEHKESRDKWWQSVDGKKYKRLCDGFRKRKILKDARQRLLKDEPKRPKTAFEFFCGEFTGEGKPAAAWGPLPAEEKQKFQERHEQAKKEYDEAMAAFRAGDKFKEFEKVERRVMAKPKAKAKGKAKVVSVSISKPTNMPKRPLGAFQLYMQETKQAPSKDASAKWAALPKEEKQPYMLKVVELNKQYVEEQAKWKNSPEGKKYAREVERKNQKLKESRARERFLGAKRTDKDGPVEPKRPKKAQDLFQEEKKEELTKQDPTLKSRAVSQKTQQLWKQLDLEGKKPYLEKAKALLATYKEDVEKYKSSDAYKKYLSAAGLVRKPKVIKKPKVDKAKAKEEKAKAKAAKAAKGKAKAKAKGKAKGKAKEKGKKAAASSDSDKMAEDSDSESSCSSSSSS